MLFLLITVQERLVPKQDFSSRLHCFQMLNNYSAFLLNVHTPCLEGDIIHVPDDTLEFYSPVWIIKKYTGTGSNMEKKLFQFSGQKLN